MRSATAVQAPEVRLPGHVDEQLHRALSERQFEMRFEPIVRLADRSVVACESLVRWRHPTLGVLEPDSFLPEVGAVGLDGELDLLVASQVVDVAAAWARAEHLVRVGMNVSAAGLANGFVGHLALLCVEHRLDPARLTVELLETIRPEPYVDREVAALHRLGVHLAIDDFGTGHASLASIGRHGVQAVKLDRVLVAGVEHDHTMRSVIRAAVEVAHDGDAVVVAEWVEREAQAAALAELGVDLGQGSLFGGPLSAEQFERTHLDRA